MLKKGHFFGLQGHVCPKAGHSLFPVPVLFCTQWSYLKNMGAFHSAPGTKAEERVFLLYFKPDPSKIKHQKF